MKEENKYAIQGYLFLGGIIYFIFFGISSYFNIFQDFLKWTALGLFAIALLSSTGFALSIIFKAIFESIESDRNDNKRNILHQYLVIVPKRTLILIISCVPFIFLTLIFYFVGFRTTFFSSVCLPILGGVVGEVIWHNLFFIFFFYVIYQTHNLINKMFNK